MVMGFPWPRRLKRLAARPGKVALRRPGRKGAALLCPIAAIIDLFQEHHRPPRYEKKPAATTPRRPENSPISLIYRSKKGKLK
jgi:hypothetical protein